MRWWLREKSTDFDGKAAASRYAVGVYLTAIMWSIYTLLTYQQASDLELTCNIVIVSAMCGGGATVLAAHKRAGVIYVLILLVPASIGLIFSPKEYHLAIGALGILFAITIAFTSNKSTKFTLASLKLKNENEVLLHHMEERIESRARKIYDLSNLDPLTGLLNRTAFLLELEKRLNQAKKQHQDLALLFIDLDGFKKINDAIGHDTGDKVLSLTAKRLKSFCLSDEVLCRWGGDEFIMALPSADIPKATIIATDIISKLCTAYKFNSNHLSIGATIGIAMYPEHSLDAAMLIRLSDSAMYHQKKLSPSHAFVFSKQLGKKIHREHVIKDGLTNSLNKSQLRLVYQPIVTFSSDEPIGFEALLRWRFNRENISPQEFIPIAEQYGLIRDIGSWVINQACQAASSWRQSLDLSINVNVSVIQLLDEDIIDIVKMALLTNNLPANRLNIEITETVFAADKHIIFSRVDTLQKMGVKVSIDDFGTDYSSLSMIQDLALDYVKIDKSFVDQIDTSGRSIIKAVVDISDSLNFLVVAEGVETKHQADQLSSMGVHFQQGYYHAKPMEYDEIQGFLQAASNRIRSI